MHRPPAAAAALALAITPALAAPKAPEVIKPELTKLVETRMVNVVPPAEDSFNFDSPQLECTLSVDLPAGMRIAEMTEPDAFTAKDSTGASMVLPEKVNGMLAPKVELGHSWDDAAPQTITLNLAPASRSATTFTCKAKCNAVVYTGTKDTAVTITNSEAPLPAAVFNTAEPITAKLAVEHGQSTITFKPGAVRGLIESLTDDGLETSGSMWNDEFVTYYLESQVDASTECTIKVRQNAATVPVMISIVDQPLP